MRTVREAMDNGKTSASVDEADLIRIFERGVTHHSFAFLAVLKMAFWKEDRSGRAFSLSTPELARENFLPSWNRDRYWRALQELRNTGDLVKVTNVQPRAGGRFASCRYRFGDVPSYVAQDDAQSIWHEGQGNPESKAALN